MAVSNLRASLRLRKIALPKAPLLFRRCYFSDEALPEQAPDTTPKVNVYTQGESSLRVQKFPVTHEDDSGIMSYIRLRENCQCPLCVDVHSKQRNFRSFDIPPNIRPKSITQGEGSINITWENDITGFDSSHVSVYTADQILRPVSHEVGKVAYKLKERRLWQRCDMEAKQHWISYPDYMDHDGRFAHAMRQLSLYGIIFLKDIPDSREMVERIATRMGPLRNTFYGSTWDVRKVPEAHNVAYTSQFLDFHMDLLYMKDPPGYQLLHCLRNSCDGGESLFADSVRVASQIERHQPKHFSTLKAVNLHYHYDHKDHHYSRHWPVVEMRGQSVKGGDYIHNVNYSPPFQGPRNDFRTPTAAKPLRICKQIDEIEALRYFAGELGKEENIFELKLNPGECVIFENRRVVHARRQFNTTSGERWLAGAYVDEDALQSCFRTSMESHPHIWDDGSKH
ncbi:hypothetical protein BJX99DRAFT_233779 [Aspergillus californicus]